MLDTLSYHALHVIIHGSAVLISLHLFLGNIWDKEKDVVLHVTSAGTNPSNEENLQGIQAH